MRHDPRRHGHLFIQPPFGILIAVAAVVVAIALGWREPDLVWGHWKSNDWDPPPQRRNGAPLRSSDGALLDSSQAVALAHQCTRPGPAIVRRSWTPSHDNIRRLEADLAPVLLAIDDTLTRFPGERRTSLTTYRRQYAGLELVTGERVIYVNAIHPDFLSAFAREDSDTTRWLRTPINVCDGWRGLWGIEYDPEKQRFRGFAFNDRA